MTIRLRQLLGVPLGIAMTVLAAGCESSTDDATPSDAAPSVAPSSASIEPTVEVSASPTDDGQGEVTSIFEIEVGDCFSVDSEQVASVLVVECSRPHAYEAFQLIDHPAGPDEPYPGDDVLLDYADTQCQPAFEEYVGTDYQASIWFIASVPPSAETWAEGDREIICTLDQQDQDGVAIEVTGSARGSAE